MKRPIVMLAACCALFLAMPIAAVAQGFSVNEHGTCAMARGGTGVASACADGSTINFNPSGIAGITGGLVGVGGTGILAQGSFTDDLLGNTDGIQNDFIPVPHLYMAYGINYKVAAGFGFFVPYGLGTIWEDTFEGPREWDLACLVARSRVLDEGAGRAEEALAAYDGDVDDEVLDLLVEARALQVAVWLALGSLSLSAEDGRLEERLAWLRARNSDAARETGERRDDGEDE